MLPATADQLEVPIAARSGSISWPDRLADRLDRLPGPTWSAYVVAAVASVATFVGIQATTATESVPTTPFHVFFALQPVLVMGTLHAVRASARRSLRQFRPLLADADAEPEAVALVVNAPARGVLLVSALLALAVPPLMLGLFGAGIDHQLRAMGFGTGPAMGAMLWGYGAVLGAVLGAFVVHLVHQLRGIATLIHRVPRLDVYRLEPVYAFSTTTALAAILLTLDNYGWYAAQPALLSDPFSLVMGGLSAILALVAFVWPLWGAHQLLVKEKRLALAQNGEAFKTLARIVHDHVASGELGDAAPIDDAMASLERERAALSRVPTWPWHTETLRSILAAVFLPLVIWLAQYALSRALGG